MTATPPAGDAWRPIAALWSVTVIEGMSPVVLGRRTTVQEVLAG